MIDTPSLIIGGLLGFLLGLALTRPSRGNVNVAIQHNISQAPEVVEEDEEDRRENWWKRGGEPPEFSDN